MPDDEDDDDLSLRQQIVVLACFGAVAGGLLLLGWLSRPSFLWEHPLTAFAVAGGACFPAMYLIEKRAWWRKLAERRARARRRGRSRRGWVTAVRMLIGLPITLGSLAILPLGLSAVGDNRHLVEAGPIYDTTVVSVERDEWSRWDETIVKVAHPVSGQPVELDGADQLDSLPAVGDRVPVVVDPADSSWVILASADWSTHWYDVALGAVITLILLTLGLAIAFG